MKEEAPQGVLAGDAARYAGGLVADRVATQWIIQHKDPTAGYRPELPEQLLHHHPEVPEATGSLAVSQMVMAGERLDG